MLTGSLIGNPTFLTLCHNAQTNTFSEFAGSGEIGFVSNASVVRVPSFHITGNGSIAGNVSNSDKKCVLFYPGCFNPLTRAHLRSLEESKDYLTHLGWNVLGGIISPTHDNYKFFKPSLISSVHRVRMIELSIRNYNFARCSTWESDQQNYSSFGDALKEHRNQIHAVVKNPISNHQNFPHLPQSLTMVQNADLDDPNKFRIFAVLGGDLLESVCLNHWTNNEIEYIVKNFSILVRARHRSNPWKCIKYHPILQKYRKNIHVVTDNIPFELSSTDIRNAVKSGNSIKFCVDDAVIQYIEENNLYRNK